LTAGTYELHGLCISSPLAIGPKASPGRHHDFELRMGPRSVLPADPPEGEVLVEFSSNGEHFYTGVDDGERYVLRVHGMCDFVVHRDLSVVECLPDEGATGEYLTILTRGAAIAFYLALRGECVLHASVVETSDDGSAVAFVGASGMGKSTLAALACVDGARFVADDLLRLDPGAKPGWIGCSAELRMRPSGVVALEEWSTAWHGHLTADGRLALHPPRTRHESGRITAVVVPRLSRSATSIEVRQLDRVEATLLLCAFPRLGSWRSPRVLEVQLDGLVRLVESAPVYAVTVPWGPNFSSGIGGSLLRAVVGAGVGGVRPPMDLLITSS
jgi:hypothetical protein